MKPGNDLGRAGLRLFAAPVSWGANNTCELRALAGVRRTARRRRTPGIPLARNAERLEQVMPQQGLAGDLNIEPTRAATLALRLTLQC